MCVRTHPLLRRRKNKGLQSGMRHYDVPTRCQMYNFASRSITVGTRCGEQLPFAVRVGFFGDITEDGTVNTDDMYLWNRRQYPDADAMCECDHLIWYSLAFAAQFAQPTC